MDRIICGVCLGFYLIGFSYGTSIENYLAASSPSYDVARRVSDASFDEIAPFLNGPEPLTRYYSAAKSMGERGNVSIFGWIDLASKIREQEHLCRDSGYAAKLKKVRTYAFLNAVALLKNSNNVDLVKRYMLSFCYSLEPVAIDLGIWCNHSSKILTLFSVLQAFFKHINVTEDIFVVNFTKAIKDVNLQLSSRK
ncbi:MAG: hypothetical protein LBJ89_01540 [Holosporales bacterium]|jgi:hypothetical protein|nr:hypothetical protein [Holosporales bacterium]